MANEPSQQLEPDVQIISQPNSSLSYSPGLDSTQGSSQEDETSPNKGQRSVQDGIDSSADWLDLIHHTSHGILAAIQIETTLGEPLKGYRILFANDTFRRLTSLHPEANWLEVSFLSRLSLADQAVLRERFRRHFLNALLGYVYGKANLVSSRLLHEPMVIAFPDPETAEVRQIELSLRAPESGFGLTVVDTALVNALAAQWPTPPSRELVTTQLLSPRSELNQLLTTLAPHRYTAQGCLLIEGTDVTQREIYNTLVQLLVGQESVLEPSQFNQANTLMKQLFRADGSLLLSAEKDQAQLFTGLERPEWDMIPYPITDLQDSIFGRAATGGKVVNIPDLGDDHLIQGDQDLLERGVRSLLLIPLVSRSGWWGESPNHMIGLVGLTSTQPYDFSQADVNQARALIPALTAALRPGVQNRFTNIHPSVRWRFEQEAERRNWGLPPAPIVFEQVYPLYGISDIRGSSDERNRAIQQDLLCQFRLALAVINTVCATVKNALIQQLRLDIMDHMATLEQGITVDAEVTLLRYLQTEIEAHFPSLTQICPVAREAIQQYQAALDADHGCVYAARARYDQTIGHINELLRDTWHQWQQSMQAITRHYCDLDATDGIDHMIYAGRAIDPNFTEFQLKSLRYEQLRAVCDCARQGFALKARYDTDLGITHLVLVQALTVDIIHDEKTEHLFDVQGSRDTRYEIVKKRIDKARDGETGERITQSGYLTVVYSAAKEWQEYCQYLQYLHREGLVQDAIEQGTVEPLQGVSGLKYARVQVLPEA